jgi:hypothetical protein
MADEILDEFDLDYISKQPSTFRHQKSSIAGDELIRAT